MEEDLKAIIIMIKDIFFKPISTIKNTALLTYDLKKLTIMYIILMYFVLIVAALKAGASLAFYMFIVYFIIAYISAMMNIFLVTFMNTMIINYNSDKQFDRKSIKILLLPYVFCYELIFAAIMLVFWFINNKVFILLLNIPGCIWFYWNFWNICKYKLGLCKAKTKNVILTSLSCFVVLVVILPI